MSFMTIEEYDNKTKNKSDVDIIEYVKEINKLTFKIKIIFINDFIELIDKNNFCIHHSMLQKYDVSNLINQSNEANRIMKQYGFVINKDYIICNVVDQISSETKDKNEYYLHPDTFKICCQRAKKTLVYSKYCMLLKKGIVCYRDYRTILNDQQKTLLIHCEKQMVKNNKIFEVNTIIKKDLKRRKKQLNTITEELNTITKQLNISKELNTITKQLNTITDEINTITEELNTIKKELNTITEKELNTIIEELNTITITEKLVETKEELVKSHKKRRINYYKI